jgi:putative addiction module component (TIGR02574 family)
MNKALLEQLLELPAAERLEVAEELWDSIRPDEMPPLTTEQKEEIERRLAWNEVRARLWSRLT